MLVCQQFCGPTIDDERVHQQPRHLHDSIWHDRRGHRILDLLLLGSFQPAQRDFNGNVNQEISVVEISTTGC